MSATPRSPLADRASPVTPALRLVEAREPPTSGKVVPLESLVLRLQAHRAAGRRVVHCHGVFDLLHIGHIKYLEAARRLGDVLAVTLTPDRFVNKGPHRPAFPDTLRAEALASLQCVDHVAVNAWPTAVETIALLRPDVYAKGSEYRDPQADVTGAITRERLAVEAVGGRLAFTDEITFSSTTLINRHLSALPQETRAYLETFATRHPLDEVLATLDSLRSLSVLVVGEAIIDEYQYCEAIGKSSKEPTLVVKAGRTDRFAGGAVAVANHVAAFCGKVTLLSQVGAADGQAGFVRYRLHPELQGVLLPRDDAPTITKRRYIDEYFFSKLLEVYQINDAPQPEPEQDALVEALAQLAPEHDVVLAADFGHGMIGPRAVDRLTQDSRFLAVNNHANAGNLGYHTLSKYPRADVVSLAENELRLEARDRRGELERLVERVASERSSRRVFITRGKRGCLCHEPAGDPPFVEVPAVATKVVDRVGAGDTFLALAAPLSAAGAHPEVAAFLGNVAGAEAVATVGHSRYLERVPFVRHVQSLLK